MLRKQVLVQDAVVAVSLMESSMQGSALLGGVNALHTSFPDDPELEYRTQGRYSVHVSFLHAIAGKSLRM